MRKINALSSTELLELEQLNPGTHTDIQCECGIGHLVVRKGYNKFLGCSCYPNCKKCYTIARTADHANNALAGGIRGAMIAFWKDTTIAGLENTLDEQFPSGINCKDDM